MIINPYIYGVAYDPDAQAFITASGISGTEATATNQLVIDLKAANIWTKMKSIYPMVGGTATSCKWNLKDARDLNAAYRLVFSGGGTFSSNGYQLNGTNAYSNTFLTPSTNLTLSNFHLSFYSRTLTVGGVVEIGGNSNLSSYTHLRIAANFVSGAGAATSLAFTTTTDARGFWLGTKRAANDRAVFRNNLKQNSSTTSDSNTLDTLPLFLGAQNNAGTPAFYSSKQCAFASIGDGLTDLESQLFYQITEKYQVALGRNINATQSFYYNSAYNNETNAFLFSTQITDTTTQTATNTLVSDLKAANIWTKMKAVYPLVGGTATSHKFNLLNPVDSDAAFRLVFAGGLTHSSTGILGGGVNGWANTFLDPSIAFPSGFASMGFYNRVAVTTLNYFMGVALSSVNFFRIQAVVGNIMRHVSKGTIVTNHTVTDRLGFHANSRTSNTLITSIDNTGVFQTNTTTVSGAYPSLSIPLFALNSSVTGISSYINAELSFAYISDALTSSELTILKSINQTFQTTLGRQV